MQTILNSGDWKGNRIVYLLLFLLLFILGTYIYFFSFLDESYSPYYGDEFFYFKNSENFYENNSLQAIFTYSGNGSRIIGLDAHGPAYPLIYGGLSKLFGWSPLSIIWINSLFLIFALSMLWISKNSKTETKLYQLILVIGSPITLFYSITYLPELIQLSGAVLLFIISRNYIQKPDKASFFNLVLLILILGLIRSTWFFIFLTFPFILKKPKSLLVFSLIAFGLCMSFLMQQYFHEQVPNTFSGLGQHLESGEYYQILDSLIFNLKRNLYFTYTYSEGFFYTILKFWIYGSVLIAVMVFRKDSIMRFGLLNFLIIFIFNMVLYKNYSWVDLRMYTPLILFLNLAMLDSAKNSIWPKVLICLNLLSFVFILPLQRTIIGYRLQPDIKSISKEFVDEIKELNTSLIKIDTLVLREYALDQLPLKNKQNQEIRYILPYYNQESLTPDFFIKEEDDQLKVFSINILPQ